MKKIKAFTLLETLIVIMVFCIGILVVLNGLSQTLRNKDYANTQIKSAFFAREWIEMVFNLRDANYHKKLPWNCIFTYSDEIKIELDDDGNEKSNSACDWTLKPWIILKISMWSGNEYIHVERDTNMKDFDWMFNDYQIFVHSSGLNDSTWFYYDYTWTDDERTWYARYLVITWVNYDEDKSIDNDKLLKIESHVLYQRWALTWEKVMETFIGNYEFKQ